MRVHHECLSERAFAQAHTFWQAVGANGMRSIMPNAIEAETNTNMMEDVDGTRYSGNDDSRNINDAAAQLNIPTV